MEIVRNEVKKGTPGPNQQSFITQSMKIIIHLFFLKKWILEECETSKQMSKEAIVEVWEGDCDGLE